MRDGRLMIPVAPAFKRKIKGIVHDESASGKTVFIEPEVVVEANNRIRELEGDERREIMKILTEFTNFIRPLIPDILQSYEFLAEIDFIRAKALFAEQINGIKPVIEDKQQIDWIHAAHPLLFLSLQKQNKQIVPLDILLEEKKRLLIISGPNAGGKSVCLKTVGLLQYMLQCGLLIPVYESSKTGLFENLFIDIGDEQSIENDLSTYSSHLTNMKFFVKNCNSKTLILIDEFGSGTEPQIGGAIAEALLDRFNRNHLADQCIDLIVSQFHTIGGNRNRINIREVLSPSRSPGRSAYRKMSLRMHLLMSAPTISIWINIYRISFVTNAIGKASDRISANKKRSWKILPPATSRIWKP